MEGESSNLTMQSMAEKTPHIPGLVQLIPDNEEKVTLEGYKMGIINVESSQSLGRGGGGRKSLSLWDIYSDRILVGFQ